YEQLRNILIEDKGKIVIARYGKSWRGTKPKVAYENGAVGCIIYSDPRDDGYFEGDVYPEGAFRPPAGVQRGSVMDMPVHVGDPLSPGWASEKGSRRLKLEESVTLMKIPVLPISYEEAQPLLAKLEGPVAPEPWRGALPITYHIGPGPSTVRLALDFDWTTKPLFNVIATMTGSTFPDQWILYGNHHDAWVNGARDPVSGAAALLETARSFSELRKQGWRPARTIKFALWDAEEFGLIGSTEWAEKHKKDLTRNAIAYFNSDSNGKGTLSVGGTPVLQVFLSQVLRDIPDPGGNGSLLEKARAARAPAHGGGEQEKQPAEFRVGALGAGSDYVAFIHHLGISSANMGFSGDDKNGIYHSIYDSYHWYIKFSDSDFVYGKALANVMTCSLMRLSEAALLPFEFGSAVTALKDQLSEIGKLKDAGKVNLSEVTKAVEALEKATNRYEAEVSKGNWASTPQEKLAPINQLLYRSERVLLSEKGLPGREWYKYQLSAPGLYTGYGAKTLPGIREAIELGRWDEGNREAKSLATALQSFAGEIEQAAEMLAAL
ncbi:MAG: M28 family peptidase, partial [Bryobacteraceae bacterium]